MENFCKNFLVKIPEKRLRKTVQSLCIFYVELIFGRRNTSMKLQAAEASPVSPLSGGRPRRVGTSGGDGHPREHLVCTKQVRLTLDILVSSSNKHSDNIWTITYCSFRFLSRILDVIILPSSSHRFHQLLLLTSFFRLNRRFRDGRRRR